jgi:hypothetical protein
MMSTIPLDITLRMVGKPALAKELYHASTHSIGIGLRGANPHDSKCWLYFPVPNSPFYRATVFSHYATKNCPPAGSLLPTVLSLIKEVQRRLRRNKIASLPPMKSLKSVFISTHQIKPPQPTTRLR